MIIIISQSASYTIYVVPGNFLFPCSFACGFKFDTLKHKTFAPLVYNISLTRKVQTFKALI